MSRTDEESRKSGAQISLFDEGALREVPATAGGGSPQVPGPPESDGRSTAVWRQWLSSMASDAEAALAAAIAYRDMDSIGRERWLSSLEFDAPQVDVPAVALYAPLLAVEQDPVRRDRLIAALAAEPVSDAPVSTGELSKDSSSQRALAGKGPRGSQVYVLASPLYLNFVQVLACCVKDGRFEWVRHDPIVGVEGVPVPGDCLDDVRLESTPIKSVLDELAVSVLSHQRSGEPLPEALAVLGDLLGPLGP